MNTMENFLLLTILGTVALVGVLLMINTAGTENTAGQAYLSDSVSLDMTTGDEYIIYGNNVVFEYLDDSTTALDINGVLVKLPNGEKVTYKGLGIFSYGGEISDSYDTVSIDFYK